MVRHDRASFVSKFIASLVATTLGCVGDTPVAPQPDAATLDSSTDVGTVDAACGVPNTPCCGTTCNGGSTCVSGSCACTAPQVACGATCVDTKTDAKNCGTCGHDCLGGACSAGKCLPITLATGQNTANSVAVDVDRVYWTRGGTNAVAGGVFSVKFDGTALTTILDLGPNVGAYGAAVGGGNVDFARNNGSLRAISRCALPTCTGGQVFLAQNEQLAQSVSLDLPNSRLYWVGGTPYQGTGGSVMTLLLPSGPAQRVVTADQPNPSSLRLANGFVYWLDSGTYFNNLHQGNGGVRRAPLGLNGVATPIAADNGADLAGLAIDSQSVYFGTGGNATLAVAPVGGGGSTSTFSATTTSAIAADGTNVYWGESTFTGRILTCPRTGCPNGNPIVLVLNQDTVAALTVDAVSVIWVNSNGGEVRRLAK